MSQYPRRKNLQTTNLKNKFDEAEPILRQMIMEGAEYFGVDPEDLTSSIRTRPLADARRMIGKFLIEQDEMKFSTPTIGVIFNRSHSTIVVGNKVISHILSYDKDLAQQYEGLVTVMNRAIKNLTNDENKESTSSGGQTPFLS